MLDVDRASVAFGPVDVLADVSLHVAAGRIVGVVGPNGAGKTTLLDAVSGLVPLAGGAVRLAGSDITRLPPHRRARLGLARTFQGLDLFEDLTATENVLVAQKDRYGPSARQEREVRALSHGERKAVALDRALAGGPRVLLLDEPAAGLDAAARAGLKARLRELAVGGLAIALADHDLDLVMDVSDDVCVLDFGRVIAHGPPARVQNDPAVLAAYLGAGMTAPVRTARTPGDVQVEARGLVAGYGGAPVVDGLDLTVRAGEIVALLGPNGAGKTTTLRALSGLVGPSAGEASVLGAPLASPERMARRGLAHVPQDRAVLPSLTVAENLRLASAGGHGVWATPAAGPGPFPALLPLRDRRAGQLSGGEQQLLSLARALAREPRVLLVDELSLGLAPRTARQALEAVRAAAESGAACLLAEQHPVLALEVADRAVVLAGGRCVFEGSAADLVQRPEVLRAAYLGGV